MCHRLFNTSWDQDAARRRAAEQQQDAQRAENERREPRNDKPAKEERRVEAEVEVD